MRHPHRCSTRSGGFPTRAVNLHLQLAAAWASSSVFHARLTAHAIGSPFRDDFFFWSWMGSSSAAGCMRHALSTYGTRHSPHVTSIAMRHPAAFGLACDDARSRFPFLIASWQRHFGFCLSHTRPSSALSGSTVNFASPGSHLRATFPCLDCFINDESRRELSLAPMAPAITV